MKRRMILISVLSLLILAAAVAPVMAIGPRQAEEVGNNENLVLLQNSIRNSRGEASGFNAWILRASGVWCEWRFRDARDAKGLMNNALVAHITNINHQFLAEDHENEWIYLSGDGGSNPDQFAFTIPPAPNIPPYTYYATLGSHGMLWWSMFFMFGANPAAAAFATYTAGVYPNGVFYMYNNIPSNNAP